MPLWLHEKLWVPSTIRRELKPYAGPILYAEHHMSHAASAFLPSPYEEAAIEVREIQDRTLGAVYDVIREVNLRVNELASGLLTPKREGES